MRAEDIDILLKRRPFVPFRIHLTDGKSYDIMHPELVLLLRSRIEIGIMADPESGIPDRAVSCALIHVVRTEDINRQPTQQNN